MKGEHVRQGLVAAFLAGCFAGLGAILLARKDHAAPLPPGESTPSVVRSIPDVTTTTDDAAGTGSKTPPVPRDLPARELPAWAAPLISAVILSAVGMSTHQRWIDADLSDEVFLRIALALLLATASIAALLHLRASTVRPKTDWWNLGGVRNDPTWDEVRRMTVGAKDDDPVIYRTARRRPWLLLKAVAGGVVIGGILIEGLTFLASGPVLPRFLTGLPIGRSSPMGQLGGLRSGGLAPNANLTALLALMAAVITVHFAYRQLQAKVRADSRQAWLDKLRGKIAVFIAVADAIHYDRVGKTGGAARTKLTASRLEMELMLNPSEKDHRLLMFLSIKLAFFEEGEDEFNKVRDVENVRDAIVRDPEGYARSAWSELLGPIPDRNSETFESAYGDLIGYIMRLSHVVLKREWQRVKETR